MNQASIENRAILDKLPPEWPEELLPSISEQVRSSNCKIAVLDDDPTGTQTVHGIPVLTTWSVDELAVELKNEHPVFFMLTNSRSLNHEDACAMNREIGANLKTAARQTGVRVEVVSRSDSTLRGHFPGEVDALRDVMELNDNPCLVIPFFLEGGRMTIDDIHYVVEEDRLVPAAQTPYARDEVFGYRHSNLRRWVEEKTKGWALADNVASVSLDDLRRHGPDRVTGILSGLPDRSYCIVNAVSYRDLEVLVSGLLKAESQGRRFVYRTAASFVRVRAGIQPRGLLSRRELATEHSGGGLFVVGSYVPKTTIQLETLFTKTDAAKVKINVLELLDDSTREREIERASREVIKYLERGDDAVLFTTRNLVKGRSADHSLEIGKQVSDSLISVVKSISVRPRFLAAKGGITSSDVATKGLECRRSMVMGQILPGVPVWRLGPETRHPGMPYIVFPGNVGDNEALVSIKRLFEK